MTRKFTIIIEKDEDGWLVSEVVELLGRHTREKYGSAYRTDKGSYSGVFGKHGRTRNFSRICGSPTDRGVVLAEIAFA